MHILLLCTWQLHIHSHHLVLMVDICSCLQQSLDYFGVSILSSCQQRNTAILYDSMREEKKQSLLVDIIVVEQRERKRRERERGRERERERD